MQEKLVQERNELENVWADPENLKMFNKPSPTLLQLRKQQKFMAMSKQFDGAKYYKNKADQLQLVESQEAQERAISVMKLHYEKMIDDQQKTVDCFNEHENRIYHYLLAEREKALVPHHMLVKQLEMARDRDKPLNLKPQKVTFQSNIRTKTLKTDKGLPHVSPRVTQVMTNFRKQEEPNHLTITGIDVKKIM